MQPIASTAIFALTSIQWNIQHMCSCHEYNFPQDM